MALPANIADFWAFTMRFNYTSVRTEKGSGQSRGWEETYHLKCDQAHTASTKIPPIDAAKKVMTARAALLPANINIVRNTLSLGSFYRDRWPIGVVPTYGLTTQGDFNDPNEGFCDNLETGLLYRFERDGLRYEHCIRGIRDSWIDDEVLQADLLKRSYGPFSAVTAFGIKFDEDAKLAVMLPQAVSGTNGSITFTVTSGVLSVPVIAVAGAGLQFGGSGAATQRIVLRGGSVVDSSLSYVPATIDVTLVSGAIDSVELLAGTGLNYTYPSGYTFTVYFDNDPLTLQQYLPDATYIRNFGSTIAQNCVFFSQRKENRAAMTDSVGTATWPDGSSIPVVDLTSPKIIMDDGGSRMRFMISRVANRQTGRMYKNKRGRRRHAI